MGIYNDSYLQHYGVLGMRWGVHRARVHSQRAATAKKRGDISTYKSETRRANQLTEKHKALSGKAYSYTNKESLGKSLVKSMIFGTTGTLDYNEMRANNTSRTEAAARAFLKGMAPTLISAAGAAASSNGVGMGRFATSAANAVNTYNAYGDRRVKAYLRTGKVYV